MKLGPAKIALIYLITSLLWIFFSDRILFSFERSFTPQTFMELSNAKGFVFVIGSALLLFKLINADNKTIIGNEKQYRSLYEGNPNPMWIYRKDTLQFVSVNDAAIARYGYTKDEFLKMTILDIRPEDDHEKVKEAVKIITETYNPSGIWRHIKKDGTVFYANISSHKITFNGREHILTLAIDTTDRVLFDQELEKINKDLAEQKKILSETQHIARIAGWEYYPQTHQLNWSDELYKITNIKPNPNKSPLNTYFDYVYPEDRKASKQAFEKLLANGGHLDIIHRIQLDNGEIRYMRQLARVETDGDKPYRVVGSLQDVTELKQLEIERNKYLFTLDDTINTINDIFFALNRKMEFTKVNDKFMAEYGMRRDEVIGKTIAEVFPSHQHTSYYKAYERVVQNREVAKLDDYAPVAGKWLRLAAYPTEEGAAVYLTDISEQIEKDMQLREAVARYDFVAEATKDVIYDYDIANNHLSYNTSVTGLVNIDPGIIEDRIQWWRSLIHPDDLQTVLSSQQKVIARQGHNWECEYRIKTGTGDYKHVSDQGYFVFDEDGQPVRLIGTIKDIDALKRSNEENKRLAGIITRINNMVIVMDNQNRIEWVNKAFEDFTGYQLSEIQGTLYGSFMRGPETSAEVIQLINEKQANREAFSVEMIKYTKAGKHFWLNAEFTPTFDKNGHYTGYIGVYQNINQRKLSQEALERQNNLLREISWISSHEIRRPVASILGLIYLIRLANSVTEKEEMIAMLEDCTHDLDGIVHSINNKINDINLN